MSNLAIDVLIGHSALAYWRGAGLAIFVGAVASVPGAVPASAASGWETGCAYRSDPVGNGEMIRRYDCDREKECQQMADARNAMMMGMGCFFVAPERVIAHPQQGRVHG